MKVGEEPLISVKGDWDYLCKIERRERQSVFESLRAWNKESCL